jgi:hypothetical protein
MGSIKDDHVGSGGSNGTYAIRLNGARVGFESTFVGDGYGYYTVEVVDLRTGRHDVNVPATYGHGVVDARVTDLALKSNGSVAWIVNRRDFRGASTYEVRRADRRGHARLDADPRIGPNSLDLSGRQLRWSHGDHVNAATLS